jgi:hypothetical protein
VTFRVIVVAVALQISGLAGAREPTTAIAPLTTGQSAPAELQRAFAEELPRALTASGFVLLPPNQVDMKVSERPEFLQCRAGGCLAEEAAFLRVRRLALPRLDRAYDGGFTVGVTIYDSGQKKLIADALARAGNPYELRQALQSIASRLHDALTRPGRLEIAATPPAALTVDGEARGTTPWASDLPAGDHVVTLEAGGARVERDVTVAPAQTARVDVTLSAPPPPRPVADGRHRVLAPLKWTALALGAAGIAAGAALLAIDGHGSCSLGLGQLECPKLWDTRVGGAALTAGGGALVLGSILMFVFDRRRLER